MTDAQFEQVMAIYKRRVGGMSAAVERTYRVVRDVGYGLPEDWANELKVQGAAMSHKQNSSSSSPHTLKLCITYL